MVLGKNKKGAQNNFWIILIGILVVAYFINLGGIKDTVNSWMSPTPVVVNTGGGGQQLVTTTCPTDGTTTYTVNVQDELTTSATNIDTQYFIFNGNKLIKEGNTGSDGTVDVDVACGKDYKLLLLNTTAAGGHYGKVIDLKARISEDTVNTQVVRFGSAQIISIVNPADPNRRANASFSASSINNFDLTFKANFSQRGYNYPLIMCQAPTTNITDIMVSDTAPNGVKLTEVTSFPKRVSANSGEQYYGWQYEGMLTPADATITIRGTLQAGSNGADHDGNMTCKILDKAMYKSPDYKIATSIEEAFPEGYEDESQADVGAPDFSDGSETASFNFQNIDGY